jgi:DNA-binding CsgD family transcriptional regulator
MAHAHEDDLMTIENADRPPPAADRERQPGDQRRSHANRRITERAARARQLTDREAQAWQLKAAGYTNAEIGRLIVAEGDAALTNQTVSNILAAAEAKIGFDSTAQAIASVRSQQLARLEHVYSEAMAAWRHSKQAKKSASKRTSRGVALGGAGRDGGERSVLATTEHETTTQTATEREGDPRFLETAMKVLTSIRQLTGTNAPLDMRFLSRDGAADVRLDHMDDDELSGYLGALAQIAAQLAGTISDADAVGNLTSER